MGKYVGLDWSSKGWFGIIISDNEEPSADLFPTILSVWSKHSDADRILIDIPIGLRNDGKRTCDKKANEMLKPDRKNSVFFTPIREAVYAKTLTEAKELNKEYGFSITNQAWSICLRIREVDEFLDEFPEAIGTVRESHPEICFAALNDDNPLKQGKKTDDGIKKRQTILFQQDEALKTVYQSAVERFINPPAWARRLSKNAKDDVLDAMVLAHTAQRSEEELATLPDSPEKDMTKKEPLPIEIVYPKA